MINELFNVMQKDAAFLLAAIDVQEFSQADQERVACIATRLFAAFGMGLSAAKGLKTVVADKEFKPSNLVKAISLFVLSHDAFVMSRNYEKNTYPKDVFEDFGNGMKELWSKGRELLKGNNPTQHEPIANETFLNSLWSSIIHTQRQ